MRRIHNSLILITYNTQEDHNLLSLYNLLHMLQVHRMLSIFSSLECHSHSRYILMTMPPKLPKYPQHSQLGLERKEVLHLFMLKVVCLPIEGAGGLTGRLITSSAIVGYSKPSLQVNVTSCPILSKGISETITAFSGVVRDNRHKGA